MLSKHVKENPLAREAINYFFTLGTRYKNLEELINSDALLNNTLKKQAKKMLYEEKMGKEKNKEKPYPLCCSFQRSCDELKQ